MVMMISWLIVFYLSSMTDVPQKIGYLFLLMGMLLVYKIFIGTSQVLEALLSLEGMMLITSAMMILLVPKAPSLLIFTFFTLAVAEASMGLGVLIYLTRRKSSILFS